MRVLPLKKSFFDKGLEEDEVKPKVEEKPEDKPENKAPLEHLVQNFSGLQGCTINFYTKSS